MAKKTFLGAILKFLFFNVQESASIMLCGLVTGIIQYNNNIYVNYVSMTLPAPNLSRFLYYNFFKT